MTKCDLSQEYKFGSILENMSNIISHINRLKKKIHTIVSIDYQGKDTWQTRSRRELDKPDKGHLQNPSINKLMAKD